ncbi:MAG: glycoside hydrolase family 43 protein [Gemmatimonadales bacterium]
MMARVLVLALVTTVAACATPAPAPTPRAAESTARFDWFEYTGSDSVYSQIRSSPDLYLNPILAGFYPDPSIVRVGEDFYIVNSSFAYFPGVPIFHSRDLVHWTQIGSVLDRPSQLNLDSAGISRGIFAPVIRQHGDRFYMITTIADRGGNFFVTATNPAGPWSDPVWLPGIDGIDPSFFFDDDGKGYVVNNGPPIGPPLYTGHRAIWMQQFDVATERMVGPRRLIVNGGVDLAKHPIWIEAPHIFRKDGRYYLICAEGGTADQHSEVVFRSDSVWGPYVPYERNPILTQRQLDPHRANAIGTAGHADFVETQNGEWWAVFLATREYADNVYNTGRETFLLPVKWVDGWPVILTGDETVPYAHTRPNLPIEPAPEVPTSGNFTIRDEFDRDSLAPYWEIMRTPRERWYDLTSSRGSLTLRPRPVGFGPQGQPSFIGRRQQHLYATATTAMRYRPIVDGDRAGLVAFQNDEHYYLLALARVDGAIRVQLEKHDGPSRSEVAAVVASAPVNAPAGQPVYLRIVARGPRYDFLWATTPGEFRTLVHDADGTILSTRKAGGFVGTMFGLYAYTPAAP